MSFSQHLYAGGQKLEVNNHLLLLGITKGFVTESNALTVVADLNVSLLNRRGLRISVEGFAIDDNGLYLFEFDLRCAWRRNNLGQSSRVMTSGGEGSLGANTFPSPANSRPAISFNDPSVVGTTDGLNKGQVIFKGYPALRVNWFVEFKIQQGGA